MATSTAGATGSRAWGVPGCARRALPPALLLLFTLSGISGLIYEVVWLRS